MKNKSSLFIYPFLLMGIFLIFASSCKEDDDDKNEPQQKGPVVSTTALTKILHTKATSGGIITYDGGSDITIAGVCYSRKSNPSFEDSITNNGFSVGSYNSEISELEPNTTYYVRAYAVNKKYEVGYGDVIAFTTLDWNHQFGTFTDPRDGNVYKTIAIGEQVWMAENLRYLPSVVGRDIESKTKPYYYVYGYDGTSVNEAKATANYTTYGVLYNWPAAMAGAENSQENPSGVQGVCPAGWHLPSNAEWQELTDNLTGMDVGGGLKETGMTNWGTPNTGATNETGFTARPGGSTLSNTIGYSGWWWTTNEYSEEYAFSYYLQYNFSHVRRDGVYKEVGRSVRCVRD